MENPQTGLLKTRVFMAGLPFQDTCYCVWGYLYRKPTRIWSNLPWTPSRGVCRKGSRCEAFDGRGHPSSAQRGSRRGYEGSNSKNQLYSIPPALCDEIADAATGVAQ